MIVSTLEIIFQTLVSIHIEMIHMDQNFGTINNLQLLAQKLKFKLVKLSRSIPLLKQQQQQQEQQQQQQQTSPLRDIISLVVSSVNDFYGVEFEEPNFLENVIHEFSQNIATLAESQK